jgi:hypothetical protein
VTALDTTLRDVSSYNDFLVATLLERSEFAEAGRLCANICRYYRARGICELLVSADVDEFFHGLVRSSLTWSWYLGRARLENVLDHPARKASFTAPFLDAVASAQGDLAARIAERSPERWRPDYEYEDDYLYARFVYSLVQRPEREADSGRASDLDRWEEVLEGGEDLRLPICRALLLRDGEAFDEAFLALAADREARFEIRAAPEVDGITAADFDFVPNARIWVEGLGLLRFAEERGLALRPEYPSCPSLARSPSYTALPVERFPPRES